jgi:hypothetical protein
MSRKFAKKIEFDKIFIKIVASFRRRANFVGTKFGGDESKGGAGIFTPHLRNKFAGRSPSLPVRSFSVGGTSFLFAHPSVQFGARDAPLVLFKKSSDFVKQTHKIN